MKEIHFIPIDEEHTPNILCDCIPSIMYPNDDVVFVVHNMSRSDTIEELVDELAVEINYDGWEIKIREEE